jgi:hypothetical protein
MRMPRYAPVDIRLHHEARDGRPLQRWTVTAQTKHPIRSHAEAGNQKDPGEEPKMAELLRRHLHAPQSAAFHQVHGAMKTRRTEQRQLHSARWFVGVE